ncbi:MAG: bifunctional (p)ppGpp synthetase/guanosine-3',5'-bis(diphosphate) 3'-pyrophosphohydrolase [Ignavibacteriae bacterium]|nr:bifunctional (p)ppGpp synthetase/guanosine-3',5'-bis(diphosphate) 3'-pyrophosphohydrolase [Ignavibacteriota bacterium]
MSAPLPLYNQVLYSREELIADVSHDIDPAGLTTVLGAYDMAASVHEFQTRSDSTPYFWHISRVARILIRELRYINADVLAAALLHDVLEDSRIITAEVIKYNFGSYVGYIVEVLTKNIRLSGPEREAEDAEYIERLNFSSIDCQIVKFSERLDNFRCMEFGVKRNPFRYIDETEKHYFPMAARENNKMLAYLVAEMKKVKGKLLA